MATVRNAHVGAVQFVDGSRLLGRPVLLRHGQARFVAIPGAGRHAFEARYLGGGGACPSHSRVVNYRPHVPPAPVSVQLAGPATATVHTAVTLAVTTRCSRAGSVTITDGAATLGAGTVVDGTGQVTVTFGTAGSHTVVAHFTDSNHRAHADSLPLTIVVTAESSDTSAGGQASETLETTVQAGSLTISVDDPQPVVLPQPVLDEAADALVTSGAIRPVTVTDTRTATPGFAVSAIVTDFVGGAGQHIGAVNLGWTPTLLDRSPGMVITAGEPVAPADGVEPGAPADPSLGLGSSRTLAVSQAGHIGTAHLGASLLLKAPSDARQGTYDATMTLTAI